MPNVRDNSLHGYLHRCTTLKGINPPLQLKKGKVARYMEILDQMPPVRAWQLYDGSMLIDGYHRLEAAKQLGRVSIAVEVQQASREDELHLAIYVANVACGFA